MRFRQKPRQDASRSSDSSQEADLYKVFETSSNPGERFRAATSLAKNKKYNKDRLRAGLLNTFGEKGGGVIFAEMLADICDEHSFNHLLGLFDNSDWRIRQRVARTLFCINDPRSRAVLYKALNDPSLGVQRALAPPDPVSGIAPMVPFWYKDSEFFRVFLNNLKEAPTKAIFWFNLNLLAAYPDLKPGMRPFISDILDILLGLVKKEEDQTPRANAAILLGVLYNSKRLSRRQKHHLLAYGDLFVGLFLAFPYLPSDLSSEERDRLLGSYTGPSKAKRNLDYFLKYATLPGMRPHEF